MTDSLGTHTPDLRLLATAVGLERFTVDELASISDCNVNTARSWVRRMRGWLVEERGPSVGRGRPRTLLNLSQEGQSWARSQLDAVRREVDVLSSATLERAMLDRSLMQFQLWRELSRLPEANAAAADAEFEKLRVSLGECWRHFAKVDALGGSVEPQHLFDLAQIEADAGIVTPEADFGTEQLAAWLVGRMKRIRDQDGTADFAARALRARIDTRPTPERSTAAALAAPVWSDEGRADDALGEEDWRAGLLIAEEMPITDRLDRVERMLLASKASSKEDDGTAQAVVRGLTACRGADSEGRLRDWLSASRWRAEFREVFAPVVIHGLLESDGATRAMREPYEGAVLEEGLRRSIEPPGRLRYAALEMGKRQQHACEQVAGARTPEQSVALFGSTAASGIASS